jgi:hypothetical protein
MLASGDASVSRYLALRADTTFNAMRTFPKKFTDIPTMPYLWPKKGDRLLRSSNDWDSAAAFTPRQLYRDVSIWDGYMTAGAALIDEAERRTVDRGDVLVYPILFNDRHGLEAAMKWTVEQYGGLANVSLDPSDLNHDLWSLWKQCKEILLAAALPGESDEALLVVEQIGRPKDRRLSSSARATTPQIGCRHDLADPCRLLALQR